ncbi:200fa863-7f12-49eb-9baf-2957b32099a6-CDS [Sclerotinia trifoliorum]|uniref:200fa863-7f12-49eb-9baf-2957b32099a6-CDS n=1 Tax=Sclerotinia trifoliorum TaxID=28548 RepID=A0A8H2VMM2_9HELO|nr:200fa863-7f12-49eb-9baf-2957b32099a6-CDS [Sclerotinia trifoliorum]
METACSWGPGVHEEILRGNDATISWEDVFRGDEMRSLPGFHEEVERKVKMGF